MSKMPMVRSDRNPEPAARALILPSPVLTTCFSHNQAGPINDTVVMPLLCGFS